MGATFPYGGLQSGLGAIGHDLDVYSATPLQDAEGRHFTISAAPPFSFYSPCSEVGFVNLTGVIRRDP